MSKIHMTLSDRVRIQSGLEKSESFKKIAKAIDKDCTTVSREVRSHSVTERTGGRGKSYNDCLNKYSCKVVYDGCVNERCGKISCRYCPSFCMTNLCTSYVKERCVKLKKPPYVCNGCTGKHENEALELASTLKAGLNRGQSVYHIIKAVGEEVVGYSAKTIYTYIDAGVFDGIGNLDLPRKVRYKARRKKAVLRTSRRIKPAGSAVLMLTTFSSVRRILMLSLSRWIRWKAGKVLMRSVCSLFISPIASLCWHLSETVTVRHRWSKSSLICDPCSATIHMPDSSPCFLLTMEVNFPIRFLLRWT